jgi:hypothetical protein
MDFGQGIYTYNIVMIWHDRLFVNRIGRFRFSEDFFLDKKKYH